MIAIGVLCVIACTAGVSARADTPVTFARDIAPLIFDRCVSCHHPGGTAPFSLATYADVRPRARLVAAVTAKHLMPPWKSVLGYGDFVGQRHLTDSEIELFQLWVKDGALEGDRRALPPPRWTGGWQLGAPDLVLTTPEPYVVRSDGPDYSRTFVFRVPIDRVRYVKGFEFQPGDSGAVHHANIRIDQTSASRLLDDQDPAPGYEGLLLPSAVYPDGYFLGWTPGQVAPPLPKGLAWRLEPGTDLVVEMHFVPTGRPASVRPSIALYFSGEAPQRTPAILRLGRQDIDIPAGRDEYVTRDSFVLPVDVDVIAVQPHAHYRARQIRGTATLPDGHITPLIFIDDWDYHWQHVYQYVSPLHFPKGTTLSMQWTFDNSAANRRNPHQPPTRAHWGQRSTDEMGDLWIQMLTTDAHDLRVLNSRIRPKHVGEEIVGYEMRIRDEPTNISLQNDVALLYKDAGQLDKAAAHFAAVIQLQPASASAHYNLGNALLTSGRAIDAIEEYRRALQIDPGYVPAHNNLGSAFVAIGRHDEAIAQFREAIRLDPDDSDAYYNMGIVAIAGGSMSDAARWLRQAVDRHPDGTEPMARLAWVLATDPAPPDGSADEAMQMAQRAAEMTAYEDVTVLNVLAAAEAAGRQFDRAVATCKAALALTSDEALAAVIRQREALYRAHRRYVVVSPQPQ